MGTKKFVKDCILSVRIQTTEHVIQDDDVFLGINGPCETLDESSQQLVTSGDGKCQTTHTIRWLWPPLRTMPLLPIVVRSPLGS